VRASTAILFRPDHWWGALLVYLAGIPERVGFDLPDVTPFLSRAISFCPGHAVERNLALVAPWTGPINPHDVQVTFPVEEVDRQDVRERLAVRGFPDGAPRVIIHPGSGTLIKQWSVDHWARVADRLAVQWGAPIIFTGGDHELLLIQHITDRMASPAIILAGETTVGQLAALYAGAKIVLGPDSGPLHLAAAVGTPTVHLYGPADPAEFGPWGDPARHAVVTGDIGCRPCRILDWPDDDPACHPCVRDIPPEAVLAAALRVTSS
jgi:heptosyltransferase-2/heptosyltransferase-3